MAGLTCLPAAPPPGPKKGRFLMATDGDSHGSVSRLRGTDAQILLDFVSEADALTRAIDTLYEQGQSSRDRALHNAREAVICSAANLNKRVGSVREAVNRQRMLTGERADALAKLSQALDFIAHVLRSSLASNWGYRVTEETAPHEVVQEWNGHWHTIRHTAINMKHWAEGMPDGTEASPRAYAEKDRQGLDEASPTGATGVGNGGMSWQDAKKRAEEHVKAHDGSFPSVKRLAEIVGCSRPTMDKAISNSTYLKARKAEAQNSRPGRHVPLSDAVIEEASERKHNELKKLVDQQNAEKLRDERQALAAKNRRS